MESYLQSEIDQALKRLKNPKDIGGSTNYAKLVAKTLLNFITNTRPHSFQNFVRELKDLSKTLSEARPNEPLAVNAVTFILKDVPKCETQQQVRIKVIDRIGKFFKYINDAYGTIRVHGVEALGQHTAFYTHCSSSLVRDVLIKVNELHPGITVINDETRPELQGRQQAHRFANAGIRVVHTIDAAVGSFFLDSRYPKPECVLVGCDGFTLEGDAVIKVGGLNVALAAHEAGLPFYVITQFMKLDMRPINSSLPFEIEKANVDIIWKARPEAIEVLAPDFDQVPAKYITGGFITEKGVMSAGEVKKFVSV